MRPYFQKCPEKSTNICKISLKQNKYKEHIQRPFVNKILSGKKVDGNPHFREENDKEKENSKIQKKYVKNYLEGHLKTNIDFKDNGVLLFINRHPILLNTLMSDYIVKQISLFLKKKKNLDSKFII